MLVNGRYELVRLLGEGGMGAVHLARDLHQGNHEVALKLLRAETLDPDAVRRFQDEFRSMTLLRHPNLVEVYDFGTLDGKGREPFLTMEYVPGRDLSAFGWADVNTRIDTLIVQCLRALDRLRRRELPDHGKLQLRPAQDPVPGARDRLVHRDGPQLLHQL